MIWKHEFILEKILHNTDKTNIMWKNTKAQNQQATSSEIWGKYNSKDVTITLFSTYSLQNAAPLDTTLKKVLSLPPDLYVNKKQSNFNNFP